MTMERALIEYMANAFWQIPLLALGAWLLLRAIKASPLAQHSIWLAVLALAVLLPARGIRQPEAPLISPPLISSPTTSPVFLSMPATTAAPQPLPARPAQQRWLPLAIHASSVRITPGVAHSVAGLYLAIALFGLIRIGLAWRAAQRLVTQSLPATLSPRHLDALNSYARRMQAPIPKVRESSRVCSPVIVGVRLPVLLLPQDFARHTEDEIEAALCHELAHLQRHDYFVNLICQLVSLPVAWHPATHAILRRIRRTREIVCDAIAARQMRSEIKYAKCLLALAQSMLHGQTIEETAQALGLFSKNTLEERVMQLTEKNSVVSLKLRLVRAAAGATIMAATILLAALVHVTPVMAAQAPKFLPPDAQAPVAFSPVVELPALPPPDAQSAPAPAASAPTPSTAAPATAREDEAGKQADVEHNAKSNSSRVTHDDGVTLEDRDTAGCKLSPEERQRIHQQLEDALKQLHSHQAALDNGEFKRQMDEARQRIADAQTMLNSAEFQKQIEDATAQAKEFSQHNKEFKKEMAELQKKLRSKEFQRQIDEARLQAADAALNSEEFKKQMAEVQQQIQVDLKRELDDAAQAIKDAQKPRKSELPH